MHNGNIVVIQTTQHTFIGKLYNIDKHGLSIICSKFPITSDLFIDKIVNLSFELFHKQITIDSKIMSIAYKNGLKIGFKFVNEDKQITKILEEE